MEDSEIERVTREIDSHFHGDVSSTMLDDLVGNSDYWDNREDFINYIKYWIRELQPGTSLLFDLLYRDYVYVKFLEHLDGRDGEV